MSNQVNFTYHIEPPGKASVELNVLQKSIAFELTNISNPLHDLLKGLVTMIVEPKHLWDEENICWINWFCDVSCMKWVLHTIDGKELLFKILVSEDLFDESTAKVVFEIKCDFMEFCEAIISELDTFIKNLGLLNYEQIWKNDEFPITYFLILKKYLIEHGLWKPNKNISNNLFDEINILEA